MNSDNILQCSSLSFATMRRKKAEQFLQIEHELFYQLIELVYVKQTFFWNYFKSFMWKNNWKSLWFFESHV